MEGHKIYFYTLESAYAFVGVNVAIFFYNKIETTVLIHKGFSHL